MNYEFGIQQKLSAQPGGLRGLGDRDQMADRAGGGQPISFEKAPESKPTMGHESHPKSAAASISVIPAKPVERMPSSRVSWASPRKTAWSRGPSPTASPRRAYRWLSRVIHRSPTILRRSMSTSDEVDVPEHAIGLSELDCDVPAQPAELADVPDNLHLSGIDFPEFGIVDPTGRDRPQRVR